MLTIEEFLRLSNRLREYYGKEIKDRFSEYTFSPNEGLITMKKVSENRRISYIELTEEAIPILEKISIEIDKINQVLFKDIPTKDIQCMIETMNKMNEKIEGAK